MDQHKSIVERNQLLLKYLREQQSIPEDILRQYMEKCNSGQLDLGSILLQQRMISIATLSSFMKSTTSSQNKDTNTAQQTKNNASTFLHMPSGLKDKSFGKYNILNEIARGGMGVVYKAHAKGDKRIVALKILTGKAEHNKRFFREAKACAMLEHDNIVPIFDMGSHDGIYYFTMKYIEGNTLEDLLKDENMKNDLEYMLELVVTIAKALHYAHEKKIIHRDLKPSNILIDKSGVPYLADFGLAKILGTDSVLTQTGEVLGTPFFMPPEQAAGKKMDKRCDIYSLGVILYQILTGKLPFVDNSFTALYRKIIHEIPIPPKEYNPKVSNNLQYICLKCLEKEPDLRYQTAKQFYMELQRLSRGKNLSTIRVKDQSKKVFFYTKKNIIRVILLLITLMISFTLYTYKDSLLGSDNEILKQKLSESESYISQHKYNQAKTLLDQIIKDYPKNGNAYAKRARVYYNNGEVPHAFSDIGKAIELDSTWENISLKGEWLKEQGLFDQALQTYNMGTKLVADNLGKKLLETQKASIYFHLNNISPALQIYQSLLKKYPEDDEIQLGVAKCYYETKDYFEAQKYLEKLCESTRSTIKSESFYYLGIIAQNQKENEVAIKQLTYALEFKFHQPQRIYPSLGKLYFETQNYEKSLHYLEKALAENENDLELNTLSAEIWYILKDFAKARDFYSKCISLKPWEYSFYLKRGECYSELKDYENSPKDLLRVAELDSGNLDGLNILYKDLIHYSSLEQGEEMEKIISRGLLLIFYHQKIDLFDREKNELTQKAIKEYGNIPKTNTTFSSSEIEKFVEIIANSKSSGTREIATAALGKMYQSTQAVLEIKKYTDVYSGEKKQIVTDFYNEMWEKHLVFKKIEVVQLLVRYFYLKDIHAIRSLLNHELRNTILEEILNSHESPIIRFFSARAMIELCVPDMYKYILTCTQSSKIDLKILSLAALKINKMEIKQSVEISSSEDPYLSVLAIEHIIADKQNLYFLMRHNNTFIRTTAAAKLWMQGDPKAENTFLQAFSDVDSYVRSYAYDTFWNLEQNTLLPSDYKNQLPEKYFAYLEQGVKDRDSNVQRVVILRAALLKNAKVVDIIRPSLKNPNQFVQLQALIGLAIRGDLDTIIEFIRDNKKDSLYIQGALFVASQASDSYKAVNFISIINIMLHHPDPRLRYFFLKSVGRAKGIGARYLFNNYIEDKDYYNQLAAILGLHENGDPSMVPRLRKFITGKDKRKANAAAFTVIGILMREDEAKLKKYHNFLIKKNIHQAAYAYAMELKSMGDVGKLIMKHETTSMEELYPHYLKRINKHLLNLYQNDKKFPANVISIARAVELDPENDRYLVQLALIHLIKKEYSKALPLVERAIKEKEELTYYYWLAQTHYRLGNHSLALEAVEKYLSFHFNDKDALLLQFEILNSMGKTAQAQIIEQKLNIIDMMK